MKKYRITSPDWCDNDVDLVTVINKIANYYINDNDKPVMEVYDTGNEVVIKTEKGRITLNYSDLAYFLICLKLIPHNSPILEVDIEQVTKKVRLKL